MFNKMVTVKNDGSIEFEIPSGIEHKEPAFGTEDCHCDFANEESIDVSEMQAIRPLQIVMLIVGTRGDVQPFIAIGKRLQVFRLNIIYY